MKKIFSALLILSCMAGLTACSNSDDFSDIPNLVKVDKAAGALTVVRSEVLFGPNASQGLIEVEATAPVEATSSQEWCTVSVNGNIVYVNVPDYIELEGRNALVTITSGEQAVDVAVHQDGAVFTTEAPTLLTSDYTAQQYEFALKTNIDVELSTSDDWITAEIVDGKLVITLDQNTTGVKRSGYVYYKYGNTEGQIQVMQIIFATEVLGDYTLWYYNGRSWGYLAATLTANSINFTYSGVNYSIPIRFVNGQNAPFVISIADEQNIGSSGSNYYYLAFDASPYRLLSNYPQYFYTDFGQSVSTITLADDPEYYDDGTPYFGGIAEGFILDGDEILDEENGIIDTWYILTMRAQSYTRTNYSRTLLTMYYVELEKDIDTGGVASRRNAPARARRLRK